VDIHLVVRNLKFARGDQSVVLCAFARRSRAEDTAAQHDANWTTESFRQAMNVLGIEAFSHEVVTIDVVED